MEISKELPVEITAQDTRKEALEEEEDQDTPPVSPQSPPLTIANPHLPLPDFTDSRDNDFTTQSGCRIKSEVQTGRVSGHYLQIHNNRVSADAARNSSKAQFKFHYYYDPNQRLDLWILESGSENGKFVAIVNDRVVVKRISSSGNSNPLTSIVHVKATYPEILFVKKPLSRGGPVCTLRLFSTSSTKYYLGFDNTNGSAMVPSKVRPGQREAKFRLFQS